MKNKKTWILLIIIGIILVFVSGLFFFGKWVVQVSELLDDYHPMMSNINSSESLEESLEYCNTFNESKRRDSCIYIAGYYHNDTSVCDYIENIDSGACVNKLSYRLLIKEIKQEQNQ